MPQRLKLLPPPRGSYSPRRLADRLLTLSNSLQVALAFTYWLIAAGAGLLSGLGILASLLFSALALALTFGLATWHRHASSLDDGTMATRLHRLIASTLFFTMGGIALMVPLSVYLVLGFWLLASLPVWLIRMG